MFSGFDFKNIPIITFITLIYLNNMRLIRNVMTHSPGTMNIHSSIL